MTSNKVATTVERALELADACAENASKIRAFSSKYGYGDDDEIKDGIKFWLDNESALRHYAEILPKYQAIMAAEPFAAIDDDGDITIDGSWCGNIRAIAVNVKLIIKPEPKA